MAERATPVQVAKQLNIRPQIVYGLIKRGKIATFPNPAGKADLVDVQETKIVVSRMHTRGPRKERASRVGRSPVRRGQILSQDRFPGGRGSRRITQVTDPGKGEGTLIWGTDGRKDTFWGTESLAQRLLKRTTRIEHTGALLGMILFQWRELDETPELADSLEAWCRENGVVIPQLQEEEHEHDDATSEDDEQVGEGSDES